MNRGWPELVLDEGDGRMFGPMSIQLQDIPKHLLAAIVDPAADL